MNHLTSLQIQQYVDGSADYMTQATCSNHLALCSRCRQEAELQKLILTTGRHAGLMMPSRSFTRRVMARLVPSRTQLASRWVLDNMGAMFSMMAVAGVTGAVVFGKTEGTGTEISMPSLDLSAATRTATDVWSLASKALGHLAGYLPVSSPTGEGHLVLIFSSVLALLLLDRILKGKLGSAVRR